MSGVGTSGLSQAILVLPGVAAVGPGPASSVISINGSATGITAHAGGGQGSAVALTQKQNRVSTVATAADSVKLPVAVVGVEVLVTNAGANALAVFPSTGGSINGGSANAAISQPVGSTYTYRCYSAGAWLVTLAQGASGGLPTFAAAGAITAHAGGGQASATALTAMENEVATVASDHDSVKLPAAAAGLLICVANPSAHILDIYANGSDTINAIAAASPIAVAAAKNIIFFCPVATKWYGVLTA